MKAPGMGHRDHPLLGRLVVDVRTGQQGTLQAVCPEPDLRLRQWYVRVPGESPPVVAWLRPLHGGREWTAPVEHIQEVQQ